MSQPEGFERRGIGRERIDPEDLERTAIEHDRDLAWELYDAQPQHPQIPRLTQSVLAREPRFTGMIILLALHRQACGEIDEARRLLHELVGRRDRQYPGAIRKLRDLESSQSNYAESLRLGRIVLREDPEADWMDRMEVASASAYVVDPETGWRLLDEAVEFCARTDPDRYAGALGQRATRFLITGAPPQRFLTAAEEAVRADPTESIIATALAYAYLFDYRPYEAADILGRVLREDPTDEVAEGGMIMARAFIDPLEGTEYTTSAGWAWGRSPGGSCATPSSRRGWTRRCSLSTPSCPTTSPGLSARPSIERKHGRAAATEDSSHGTTASSPAPVTSGARASPSAS
jgi:tetratricopeptide (TPR) repeat protein